MAGEFPFDTIKPMIQTPVFDQGDFNTCWAIAIADATSIKAYVTGPIHHDFVIVSPQTLVDRFGFPPSLKFIGYLPVVGIYAKANGLPSLHLFPYVGGRNHTRIENLVRNFCLCFFFPRTLKCTSIMRVLNGLIDQ